MAAGPGTARRAPTRTITPQDVARGLEILGGALTAADAHGV
ncbi:hypothetical protein ACFYRL_05360 [Streptomyces goshikiensis]